MKNGLFIEERDRTKVWYLNGKFHREDGPAIEYVGNSIWKGTKEWWINGKLHRINGPAVECNDGTKKYYLNGKKLSEQEWKISLRTLKLQQYFT